MTRYIGYAAGILLVVSCMISAGNASLRYIIGISSNAWLEIQWHLFVGAVMLGAPYVLQLNEHVRVDLVYGSVSARGKLWIDVFGMILFLFPATALVGGMAWPFFVTAFESGEVSSSAGGLILWPVKLILPIGFALLFLQGASELIKRIAALAGFIELNTAYEKPLQ